MFFLADESVADHFDNPATDGVMLRLAWKDLEPEEGRYELSEIDRGLSEAARSGKRLGIGVAAGFRCPPWLGRSGARILEGTLRRSFAPARRMRMPLPWDRTYQKKWGAFLSEAGRRYDGDPRLAYVVMAGMGTAFEPFMARDPEDVEEFERQGGLKSWIEGSERIVDLYIRAFPKTPVILVLNRPIPSTEGENAALTVARYGLDRYPGHFGLMNHGLDATASADQPYHRLISKSSSDHPVGYQMVWSTSGRNARWLKGSLQECLARAAALGAHWVEVYGSDCDDPTFTKTLRGASRALKANAARSRAP